MIQISQGAEAILYKDGNVIIKERVVKEYRLKEIDNSMRKFRTRRESKILKKLDELKIPAPKLIDFSDKDMTIKMSFIPGDKIRDILDENKQNKHKDFNSKELAEKMGKIIGKLHNNDIVHGDLTTSNMILNENDVYLIDFGLSQFSEKVEDKAVDLFLLDRALESKHYQYYPEIFEIIIESYTKSSPDTKKVMERYLKVKSRGRNKNK